jgi:FKBP-type peptidyl-prolyl cis-trans isomerase FklB
MKLKLMTTLGVVMLAIQVCAEEVPLLKTENEKVSYGLGVDMARNFKKQELNIDLDLLQKGLKDGMSGGNVLMSEKELRTVMSGLQNEMRKKMVLSRRLSAGDNMQKGTNFLAANKIKDGVTTLPSGVQYRIIKAGDGRKPTDADTVECHYRGKLIDGTEFDGTEAENPATLKVSQLIAGWKEALKLMPVGSKWQIFIPSQFAYGERGAGINIGPNETLVFEVELLAIK